MTNPVTLDLSKAQPISGGVTLDLSKAQPIGPERPRGGAGGSWEDQDSAPVRFLKGAWDTFNGILQSGAMGVSNEAPPVDAQGKAQPPSFSSMKQELVDFAKNFAAQKEVDEGDYAKAAGKILTNLFLLKSAHEAGANAQTPESLQMGPAEGVNVPGLSPNAAKVVGRVAGGLAGAGAGSAMGHPFLGMIAGERLGAAAAPKLSWEGFNIGGQRPAGLPDAVGPQRAAVVGDQFTPPQAQPREVYPARGPIQGPQMQTPGVGPQRAANVGPKPVSTPEASPLDVGAVQEARDYFQQKLAQRKANQPPPTPTVQPEQPKVSPQGQDATDLAKALGLKNAAQAAQRYGAETWTKMVQGHQDVASTVEQHVPASDPALQEATKAKVTEALAAGEPEHAQAVLDVAKNIGPEDHPNIDFKPQLQTAETRQLEWSDILDDKAWKQQMENDYGTDAEVNPRSFHNWADTFESQQGKANLRKVPTSRQGRMAYAEAAKQFIEDNAVEMPKLQGAANNYPIDLSEYYEDVVQKRRKAAPKVKP